MMEWLCTTFYMQKILLLHLLKKKPGELLSLLSPQFYPVEDKPQTQDNTLWAINKAQKVTEL